MRNNSIYNKATFAEKALLNWRDISDLFLSLKMRFLVLASLIAAALGSHILLPAYPLVRGTAL